MATRTNERGNQIVNRSSAFGNRYKYDFDICTSVEGWEQYDTNQDASYFGIWCNKAKLTIVSYLEGDEMIVVCPDEEHYNAKISSMNEFYGEGYIAKTFTHDSFATYRQDRGTFFIA